MMVVASGIFWTLCGAGAQLGFIAGVAGGAYWFKVRIERRSDREDERRKQNR